MAWMNVKHVKKVHRNGKDYWYHRKTGERLPNDLDKRLARAVEINETLKKAPPKKQGSDTFGAVCNRYRASPEFKRLADRTRKEYQRYITMLCLGWGSLPASDITDRHIYEVRDRLANKPATADHFISVLRTIFAFAVDRRVIKESPFDQMRRLKKLARPVGHKPWPQWAIDRYLKAATPMMRLALLIGLFTGQREGDVLKMAWGDYDGTYVRVCQDKTDAKLTIRVHSALKEVLDAQKRVATVILTTETGKAYGGSNFRHHWRKVITAAGLDGYTFHGLRYTAASSLAEMGCPLKEIAAITGHKSLKMLEKYSAGADQQRLAEAAVLRWEKGADRTRTKH